MNDTLRRDIEALIEGDVVCDDGTLDTYSHDASLFTVRPTMVVYPRGADDIGKLVAYVSKHKDTQPDLSLTVRSAGTCMSGGSINTSIIVDVTRYMNRLGDVDVKNQTLDTDPGVYYRAFRDRAATEGLFYPTFPASESICAMGGILGNNGAGEKSLKYGQAKDYIIEQNVILRDGQRYTVKPLTKEELDVKMAQGDFEGDLYKKLFDLIESNYDTIMAAKPKVTKNSAGYYLWNVWNRETGIFDLGQLLVGSQGTLGITTHFTMKLVPIPKDAKMVAVFMDSIDHLGEAVNMALAESPESIEAYDDKTIKLALRFWFGFLKKRGLRGAFRLGVSFLPELWYMIRKGIPKLVLLVEFTGDNSVQIERRVRALGEQFKGLDMSPRYAFSKAERDKFWSVRHDSFALLREHFKNLRTAPFVDDVIVPPEKLIEFIPWVRTILDEAGLTYNIHGHAGNGNFHLVPLMDLDNPLSGQKILEVAEKVYGKVIELGGSITAEHNDGIIRTPFLAQMYGEEMYELFKQTKDIFDPKNIFNPGKKVRGTKQDILRSI